MAIAGEDSAGAAVVGCSWTSPCSAEVRGGTTVELSRIQSVALVTIIFLVTLAGIVTCLRLQFAGRKAMLWSLWAVLAAASLVIATYPFSLQVAGSKLEVTVLDVGQGDSLFVVSPTGKTSLIDGGGAFGGFPGHEEARGSDPGEEAVSPYLWSRGFKKIDVVALTHAHQDHLGGLNAILENFRVGRLWIGREVNNNAALTRLKALARERNIPVEYEARGNYFSLDEVQGEFLWLEISKGNASVAAKNNDSLVLRLKYRNRTLLLPGDAEKQAEHAMLTESSADLRTDVSKVGHHGSKKFNDAGISGCGSTDNCDHFVGGRQSLWAPQPGITGAITS